MIEPLTLARALNDVGALSLLGTLAFRLWVFGPVAGGLAESASNRLTRALDRLAGASLALALAGDLAWLVLQGADMAGEPLPGALAMLPTVIAATHFGRVAALRVVLLLLAGASLWRMRRAEPAPFALTVGAIVTAGAVAAQAWAGHAVAVLGPEGDLLLISQAVHMLAAGAWLGALLPLYWLLGVAGNCAATATAARRFSALGLTCVGALLVTAAIGVWQLIGGLPALLGTAYGQAALIKLALLIAMLALAAINRFHFSPVLATNADAVHGCRRSIALETALGLTVVIVAAQLASMPPGTHVEPWWPLPWRFSTEALQLPGVPRELLACALGVSAGVIMIASAAWLRRLRLAGPLLGITVLVWCLRTPVQILSAEAFPTSFWHSPTNYGVASIARGAQAFATNCATCHGAQGHGDGSLAKGLRVRPADLTAEHVYDHSDGDLFWWISHGIADSPMPGFAATLDETTRWNLIDFVHANADAARLTGLATEDAGRPKRAPNFTASCPDRGAIALAALRGRVVHLVFADPRAPERLEHLAMHGDATAATIVVGLPPELRGRLCTADDPAMRDVYGLDAGTAGIDGAEFLIDAAGWLRASWHPGMTPPWTDPAVLRDVIAALGTAPVAPPPMAMMHHHH